MENTQTLLTKKQKFTFTNYQTLCGQTIEEVNLGWESYGELNSEKSNAILVCHYFSGNSHAAGKYDESDAIAGYWDSIIGAGKAIDTNKFFVFSMDSLVNLNPKNPKVITTGPSSINPKTGKQYAMDFPIVTIKDFVNLQKALVDSLGITKLHAVVGASMGSMQTYEWAASYPNMMQKIMPVIGTSYASPHLIALTQSWSLPLISDANWNGGNYYDAQEPSRGLVQSLMTLTLNCSSYKFFATSHNRDWADAGKNPRDAFANSYKISKYIEDIAKFSAQQADANHFLYLIKANQLFSAGHTQDFLDGIKNIKAQTLLLYSELDTVFYPEEVLETAKLIAANGAEVRTEKIPGINGHLDGVFQIQSLSQEIKDFLES